MRSAVSANNSNSTGRSPGFPGTINGRTLVMGIVNVTPDSFSDGGNFYDEKAAVEHAYQLIEAGADILDIGGESTRPGHEPVAWAEEWKRIGPVVQELTRNTDIPVSVDTMKARVADRALQAGATIINDVWGGLADPDMIPLIAEAGCTYIWMHNRNEPATDHGFEVLLRDTRAGIVSMLEAGVTKDQIWIDPGVGFGKTHEQNLAVLKRLQEYCGLGYPVLLGTSRKRVVGLTLDLPVEQRLEGSLATVSQGVVAGVHAVRVHDVQESVRTCRMMEAILGVSGDA